MTESILNKKKLIAKIDLLTDNLIHLNDPTGEFSIKVADGSIIDNKSFNYWEWTSGVGLYGLMKYYQLTSNPEILTIIVDWYDKQLTKEPVEKNINTMSQMLTLSYLFDETHNRKYLPYLEQWSDWLFHYLPRTHLGGFQHVVFGDPNHNEMWADTLMMSVLTLAKVGLQLNRYDYVEEAKKQFLLHIKFLQDTRTGLWYHGWTFDEHNNFGGVFWGRGNSWATIVVPEFLALLKLSGDDAFGQFLLSSFNYQIEALKKEQDESGLWHTVLNDKDSYLEASATAGFTYGLLKALHEHYIDEKYRTTAMLGINGLLDNIDEQGSLAKVSAGTPMGMNADFYKKIKISTMPYGQSMAIIALTEYLKEFY